MKRCAPFLSIAVIGCCLSLWATQAVADVARDPTLPPPELSAAPGAVASTPLGTEGMSVVMREGKPYLVVGTRLHAVGQTVGMYTIDRITETEVWLRQGKSKDVTKVPRFTGIQRTAVVEKTQCAAPAPTVAKPAAPAASKPKKHKKVAAARVDTAQAAPKTVAPTKPKLAAKPATPRSPKPAPLPVPASVPDCAVDQP